MTELERHSRAIDHLFDKLNEVASRWFWDEVHAEVKAILNPAPVYEEIEEIVGWVNVYQEKGGNLMRGKTYDTEGECDKHRDPSTGYSFLVCQPIKVTVQREKPRPVEHTDYFDISADGRVWHINGTVARCLLGKRVTVTWEE